MKESAHFLKDRNNSENIFLQESNTLCSFSCISGCNFADFYAGTKKKLHENRENGKRKRMEISFLPFLRVETGGGLKL